jgi:hypothetical protein
LVGSTIVSNEDLVQAVHDALKLDRDQVLAGSQRWTWERAWAIFRDNLVTKL